MGPSCGAAALSPVDTPPRQLSPQPDWRTLEARRGRAAPAPAAIPPTRLQSFPATPPALPATNHGAAPQQQRPTTALRQQQRPTTALEFAEATPGMDPTGKMPQLPHLGSTPRALATDHGAEAKFQPEETPTPCTLPAPAAAAEAPEAAATPDVPDSSWMMSFWRIGRARTESDTESTGSSASFDFDV